MVCVSVVNLMIVCEVLRGLLCGASPPHEATVKHEIMARAQISQDDGKEEQLSAACSSAVRTTAHREVHYHSECVFICFYCTLVVIFRS